MALNSPSGPGERRYPAHFLDFLEFLCGKYGVERSRIFIEYSSRPPPPLKGGRPGYYDGLLSYRDSGGDPEFLITVFRAAQDPLLTLGHEFAHLVLDLKTRTVGKRLLPPDDQFEQLLDEQARNDLHEFRALG